MPNVSIVVPVYNVAAYLPYTVASLLCQTETEIEILLVDDGSTDESGFLCDQYALKDLRIRVIHKVNGGLSDARNTGIREATGEYIMLVDGDDYLRFDAVERAMLMMQKVPSDIIQFRYQEVCLGEKPEARVKKGGVYSVQTPAELFSVLYRIGGEAASACTKLFARELLLRYPFKAIQHEDEQWCTEAYQEPLKVTYIPDILYFYVMRENSITHDPFNKNRLDIFKVSEERISVLESLRLSDLLAKEYTKLFIAILNTYRDAKTAKDVIAIEVTKTIFFKKRKEIQKSAHLQGRYKQLFNLMRFNFRWTELYRLYCKLIIDDRKKLSYDIRK